VNVNGNVVVGCPRGGGCVSPKAVCVCKGKTVTNKWNHAQGRQVKIEGHRYAVGKGVVGVKPNHAAVAGQVGKGQRMPCGQLVV